MRQATLLLCLVLATTLHGPAARAVVGQAMTAGEMQAVFFGRTLDGEYSDGLAWSERFDASGRSVYAQEGAQAQGRIVFVGNVICFRYEAGFSGGCFEVWRRSANCFDFYGVESDRTAAASLRQRRSGTGWTARAWHRGKKRTCQGDLIG